MDKKEFLAIDRNTDEIIKRIIVCSVKDAFDKHRFGRVFFGTRPPGKSIIHLSGYSRYQHFGNPFRTDEVAERMNEKYNASYKGYGSVKEVSELFALWIVGEECIEVEPSRAKWIKEMIEKGELDNVRFTYWRESGEETNHIKELLCLIKYLRGDKYGTN